MTYIRAMRFMTRLVAQFLCLAALLATPLCWGLDVLGGSSAHSSSSLSNVVTTPQVRAELLVHSPQGLASAWVGLHLQHQTGWHTYWKNPGDSGLPTQLQWTLPPGVRVGDMAWPTPKPLTVGDLVNYGYEGSGLLAVPLYVDATKAQLNSSANLKLELLASWLVCRTECIPQEGRFSLTVPTATPVTSHAQLFQNAQSRLPQELTITASSTSSAPNHFSPQETHLLLTLSALPPEWVGKRLMVFLETPELVNPSAPWTQSWSGRTWSAQLPYSDLRGSTDQSTQNLAVVVTSESQPQALRVSLPVVGPWPEVKPAIATTSSGSSSVLSASASSFLSSSSSPALTLSFWAALGGALLGGLILNLMPCVFPILTLKVLSFSKQMPVHQRRLQGLAYTLGVVLSFVLLGLLLVWVREAGALLGWGFQLQQPAVVAALACLFTLLGLNLAGVFEFGTWAPSALLNLHARHPMADSFLTGVLAVVVASPCTAPFMGASLGLAVTLPASQALLIFMALGLGLASPYLLASFVPTVARSLPKPGVWMDQLKRMLAFPMWLTVVWLIWVLGQQNGIHGAASLLAQLVLLSGLVWALGLGGVDGGAVSATPTSGRFQQVAVLVFGLLWVALTWSTAQWVWRDAPQDPTPAAETQLSAPGSAAGSSTRLDSGSSSSSTQNAVWQAWSAKEIQNINSAGQAVLVDFTAAWCVTCQWVKQTTLSDPKVLAALQQHQVRLMRADWTRRDPAITAALQSLGRSGVPVYALYLPGQAPVMLPELLTAQDVFSALETHLSPSR